MKNIQVLCTISFLLMLASCQKNPDHVDIKAAISLSSSQVAMNQTVFATASVSGSQQAVIRWSIQPAENNWLSAAANRSVMLFYRKGTYTVTANYFTDSSATIPFDSSSSAVNVSDSAWSDSTLQCNVLVNTPFSPGDQIMLTPYYFSDSAGLVLTGHTQQLYMNPLEIGLTQVTPVDAGSYAYQFNFVQTAPCIGASSAAPAITYLFFQHPGLGTHPLTLEFNGVDYTGSIVVTETDCTIVWNETSGILISPLHIVKQ